MQVNVVDQIPISGDGAGNLFAEIGGAAENLLNGFNGEIGVASVDDLKNAITPKFPKGARLYLKPS